MDLNQALNLQQCNVDLSRYKDYRNIETHKFDLNNNFSSRTFDITPENIHYSHARRGDQSQHQPRAYQPDGLPPHALPEMVGAPMMNNHSHFPPSNAPHSCHPSAPMSTPFLEMKHAQEKQTVLERSDMNPLQMERLKAMQAMELQQQLQKQQNFAGGPAGLYSHEDPQFAPTTNNQKVDQTYAYNAQGVTVDNKQTLFPEKANKYQMLKKMSPEMLNRMYGRESDQSVLPQQGGGGAGSGDIYDQTSIKTQIAAPQRKND
jgi:hypothetical protein